MISEREPLPPAAQRTGSGNAAPAGAPALRDDLLALARRFDGNGGGPVAIPAQYVEALAVRA